MPKKRGLRMLKNVTKTVRAASRPNPPFWSEAFFVVAPAVGTYAVTRLAGRAARIYLGRRFPKARPFLPLAGSLAAAGVMYYAASKVSDLKKYKTAVMVGAGVALSQTLLLTLAPQLGWLFDLPVPARQLPARASQPLLAADAALDRLEAQAASQSPSVADDEEEALEGAEDLAGDDDGLAGGWASPLTN